MHFDVSARKILDQFEQCLHQLNLYFMHNNMSGVTEIFEYFYQLTLILHARQDLEPDDQDASGMKMFLQSLHQGINIKSINKFLKALANKLYCQFGNKNGVLKTEC